MSQHTSQISILLGGDNNLVFPTEVRAGRVPGGTIILPENEHNDQERSHCSKKNERLERVLKNFGTISKRTERNGNCLKRTVKIVNEFLFSRTACKLGTQF